MEGEIGKMTETNCLYAERDVRCVNLIRTLSIDAIQKANSGHPGAPMGLAPAAYVLWTRIMNHNPENPEWVNRDRFVLSGGHASMLLYSMLYLTGYDLNLEDLRNFRQLGSKTPGHPEYDATPGVETTTGPLGQGIANAVGFAIAERYMSTLYNRDGREIIDHYTYVMCGDGDMMEGVSSEAVSLAGHLGLGKLICIYDDNEISIEGKTEITFTENVKARFEACGWGTIEVPDGNDLEVIHKALAEAGRDKNRPTLVLLKTQIAYGSPNKQGSEKAHGSPLGEEEVRLTKKNLGFPEDRQFYVPDELLAVFRECVGKGAAAETEWRKTFDELQKLYPNLIKRFQKALKRELPDDWASDLPVFEPGDAVATRSASGKAINAVAEKIPFLIGGSSDLAPSNNTLVASSHDFQKNAWDGGNIRFGVREHAMGGVLNGMALYKGLIPYGGTFLVFSDYMRPAIRLAALMELPVIYVFTHDSIAVGEDGPTHQPVEHTAALRSIPGLTVIRPADASETITAWEYAVENTHGPTALILSRQKLPVLDRTRYGSADLLKKGGYVLENAEKKPDIILIATGSEVHIALEAAEALKQKAIEVRTVNMPSWELFEKSPKDYQDSVLPPDVKHRIAVEAGVGMGWERYTGDSESVICMNSFGASGPGGEVMKKFGFTAGAIVEKALEIMEK